MEGELLLHLFIAAIFALICALVAKSRGRSPIAWFFIGGFFGCFALIVLFVIQDLKVEEEKQRRREKQIERLTERQRKDRASMDQRLEAQNQRLTAHDQAIGIDTSAADPAARQSLPAPPRRSSGVSDHATREWFFAEDADTDEEFGPVSFEDLRQAYVRGEIGRDSLVWNDSMPDWATIEAVPGLLQDLEGPA